ncbi:MAG TPA: FemAB family XrtA/PEP-CTERM system-associated protein [Terriglobales bacterium]|nr:FemAB family XrtA/PEP-CTERM system-associated protein [Terriglobales bacterium]
MIAAQATLAEPKLQVRQYEESLGSAWDEFVLGQPSGTLFHLTAWKRAIEKSFGFQPRYLLVEDETGIRGVLPLFLVSNAIQGKTLISTPFAVYGGICAADEHAATSLREAASELARKERVQYLELRERQPYGDPSFHTKELYVSFDQELPETPEQLMKGFPRDTRYMIRKGQKEGLRSTVDSAHLPLFHHIYAHSVRNLGTPVFSLDFFRTLLHEFRDSSELTIIWKEEQAIAGVLSFRFHDCILPYYGGSLPEGRRYAANNFMYWDVMTRAMQNGLRRFDFGRSKVGTGAYAFKTQWNMREHALPYQFFLVRRKDMPNFSPANPRFQAAISLWKRIPLPVTKMLGPSLVRLFP